MLLIRKKAPNSSFFFNVYLFLSLFLSNLKAFEMKIFLRFKNFIKSDSKDQIDVGFVRPISKTNTFNGVFHHNLKIYKKKLNLNKHMSGKLDP